jgi:multiple sugar transport system substrate-binding protein
MHLHRRSHLGCRWRLDHYVLAQMSIQLKGLTWDHPRATSPLHAAADSLRRIRPDINVHWVAQPLSGFEERPIADAARAYDLIVFDHPYVGEVAEHGMFHTMDAILAAGPLTDADFVGPSLATYRYDGQTWGLPLDAACQVSCARADLLAELGSTSPGSWNEVLALGEIALRHKLYLGIAYAGVHSLMTMLSLCANQSLPLGSGDSSQAFPDRSAARGALGAMKALLPFCTAEVLDWNSIAVQDAMCARDDLVYCPAVYGFSPYAHPERRHPLLYRNLPGIAVGSGGSTIGGAGLGVSAFSNHPEAAFAVAEFLVEARVQEEIIAMNDGQPARTSAWDSRQVNQRSGNFYSGTRATMDGAWIRPRFSGYLYFQRMGGTLVEAYLRGSLAMEATLDRLEEAWFDARCRGS